MRALALSILCPRTLVLHAPLELDEHGLAREALQEGLGVDQDLWCAGRRGFVCVWCALGGE